MKKSKKPLTDVPEKESPERIISKENAEELLKVMLEGIEDALIKGESVKIDNVGTFKLKQKEQEVIPEEIKPSETTPEEKVPEEKKPEEVKSDLKNPQEIIPEKEIPVTPKRPHVNIIPPVRSENLKKRFSFERKNKSPKKLNIKRDTILFFVIISIPVLMLLYFLSPGFHSTFNRIFFGQNAELPLDIESDMNLVNAYMDSLRNDSVLREEQNNLTIDNVRLYAEYIAEFTTESDMTLEQIAKEYYGNEIFWVYIYDANKEKLTSLRRVKSGTVISIPKIPEDLLDANNSKSTDIAYKMMDIILKEKDQRQSTRKMVEVPQETEPAKVSTEVPVKVPEKTSTAASKTTATKTTAVVPVKTKATSVSTESTTKKPGSILAEETLTNGERLTMFAVKYYGNKDFWVYIYEANKDVIKNPNDVPIGTTIKIPALGPDKIDSNNPECLQKAKLLHEKYVKRPQ